MGSALGNEFGVMVVFILGFEVSSEYLMKYVDVIVKEMVELVRIGSIYANGGEGFEDVAIGCFGDDPNKGKDTAWTK